MPKKLLKSSFSSPPTPLENPKSLKFSKSSKISIKKTTYFFKFRKTSLKAVISIGYKKSNKEFLAEIWKKIVRNKNTQSSHIPKL